MRASPDDVPCNPERERETGPADWAEQCDQIGQTMVNWPRIASNGLQMLPDACTLICLPLS